MDLDPVILSRVQFAFVISFHIIFPAFTIGLAAWLATIEGMRLVTGNPIYRRIFDFWVKVFVLAQSNLFARSWGLVFPAVGGLALAAILAGAGRLYDGLPFALTVLFFVASFLSLGCLIEGLLLRRIAGLPVIAIYTIGVYWVFRGKVRRDGGY